MGTTGGGVFKTIDGGVTWTPVTDKYFGGTDRRDRRQSHRIPTSSTSAAARRRSAATCRTATACGSPPTPEKRGATPASPKRARSVAFAFIRRIPTSSTSLHSVTSSDRTPSAAFSSPRTAARAGEESYFATTPPARSTSRWIRPTRTTLYAVVLARVPHAVEARVRRNRQRHSQVHRRRRHVDEHHRAIPGLPAGTLGNIGITVSPRIRTASGRSSKPTPAACSAPMTPARRGRTTNAERKLRQRAWYYTQHLRRPEGHEHRLRAATCSSIASTDGGKTFRPIAVPHGDNPRPVDRAERHNRMIEGERRRRERLVQRRADVDRPGLRDRAVLSRHHDEPLPVPGLRRAAGQLHALRAEPEGRRHLDRRLVRRRRRRVAATSRRAPTTPTSSSPAATAACSRARTCAPASSATSIRGRTIRWATTRRT